MLVRELEGVLCLRIVLSMAPYPTRMNVVFCACEDGLEQLRNCHMMPGTVLPYYRINRITTRRITHLLVDKFLRRIRHANNETVGNELRQYFHIPKMRRLVLKVVRQCVFRHIRRSLPQIPLMAPYPKQRLTAFVRPFTFVGLDYFGPLLVRRERAQEKRWVALFTCPTIRAIHLEVV